MHSFIYPGNFFLDSYYVVNCVPVARKRKKWGGDRLDGIQRHEGQAQGQWQGARAGLERDLRVGAIKEVERWHLGGWGRTGQIVTSSGAILFYSRAAVLNLWITTPPRGRISDIYMAIHNSSKITATKWQ